MSVNIHNRRTRNLGFTLVEIMVVVGIIGTLSSVVTNSLNESREKARDSARIQQLHQIQKALNQYYSDTGRYPLNWNQYNETAIVTLPAGQPSGTAGACDGYLAGIPGGGVDTPGCPLCSHLTLPNPEAFTLSMQELVNAGYLPRVPRSQPNEPAICYQQTPQRVYLVTTLEGDEPSTTGRPGTCRLSNGTPNNDWCEGDSPNTSYCLCIQK